MSFGSRLARALCRLPIRLLVNHRSLPEDPVSQLGLDPARPIVYALNTDSLSDLLTLELCTRELGLPSPFTPLTWQGQSHPRYVCLDRTPLPFGLKRRTAPNLATFQEWLALHQHDSQLDVQLVPVTLLWQRAPGRERRQRLQPPPAKTPHALHKALIVALYGRENRVRFSLPVSLRQLVNELGYDEQVAHKLARVARIHFSRQRQAAKGPRLPDRRALFNELLRNDNIVQAIREQAASEQVDPEVIRARALSYLDEIGSDFSYRLIRFLDYFLGWLWNKLYRGITVNGGEEVRRLAREGHEIIYMPCHRSHMDYLLLSYVIYHQGMMPPHIAAGINLNFWPAGPLFRHGGAFFLRRSFKGDKLYSTVFREYLSELFARGYAVEYFTEGGRSRTGRLLQPKTGMIAMTLQAQLRGVRRPLTFVPVYLGYEHVMEVNTYLKELKGSRKEKENVWQVIGILGKLRNFGRSFVNFGEPLTLHQFLQQQVPQWRDDMDPSGQHKPAWLGDTVDQLARDLMTRINDAAAVNGLTLSALALLASDRQALPRDALVAQIDLYIQLLRRVPYSPFSSVPELPAATLLDQALELNKFQVTEDRLGQIISVDRYQAILMTFYRNTILHLFALPGLVATLIERHEGIDEAGLLAACQPLYPLMQRELFLRQEVSALPTAIAELLAALQQEGLIEYRAQGYWVCATEQQRLLLLAQSIQETLQRYALTLSLLQRNQQIDGEQLAADSQMMAMRLATLHGIHAPEFSDQSLFRTLLHSLRQQGVVQGDAEAPLQVDAAAVTALLATLLPLLPDPVRRTIQHLG
ncbi:MAG: glycerol-3-phosphate 1-O-acyltransferase PlsB [Aeromonadaceae bacterium]